MKIYYLVFIIKRLNEENFLSFSLQFNAIFLGESVITDEKKKPLFEAFGWLNSFLQKGKYVAGDKPTIADLSLLATMSGMIVSRYNKF